MCVMMVAGVRNAGEPGAFERQGGGAGAAVKDVRYCCTVGTRSTSILLHS